jgi:glycosyltransferase involved in cell wall biosynthesis
MSLLFPKITIVTPSFNQGQYLEDTILSVINQGYPNLEYIIIDGGSTDRSVEIIRKYEQHLKYWVSEKDQGLYHALQKGFSRSTGDIMAWINSDDMYHRKSLFIAADIFSAFHKVQWLMGTNTFYDENGYGFVYDEQPYQQRWSKLRLYLCKDQFIQQESVFWRRDLWNKAGGFIDVNHSLAADFELWLRFFRYEKLYTTSFMLGGFRLRTVNQKSHHQRSEYLQQASQIADREYRSESNLTNLHFYRLLLFLVELVPVKKWRTKAAVLILKLPPKITFDRFGKFVFSRK